VEYLDPIKQLQSLLDDRGKVLEKISGIHSALNSIKTTATPPSASEVLPTTQAVAESNPSPAGNDRSYDRLLRTLRDMQLQIEQRVLPLAQLTVQAEVESLREQSHKVQAALQDCLTRIDQGVLTCGERHQEYQRTHSDLAALNQRIAALGAAPESLPEGLVAQDFSDTINLRLEKLRLAGKL
jgi:vacuolar-type H+-ATPase subunit I/STV1